VIAAAAYFLLLAPVQAEVTQLRAQLASLQSEIARSRAIVADLLKYRREVAELEARLNALKERLPGEKEIPTLYRTVSDAATASGLGVSLFQPRPPVVRDYYSEIPISLNAEAGYHQIGEFFERVAKLARVVNITEIKFNGLNRPRVPVRAELVLATYMYRPVGAPPAPKPPGAR
jgi:type IV pilus assembly protein PilO